MYNMSYSGVVSSVPFLVIIIVFSPVRTTDQIWWRPFQIPHLCEILHILTCKSSHVEHVIRLPSINLYYFNLLFMGYPKALLMVTSSIIQYSKTLLIEFYRNRFLMMYILNNVTKQPPDYIKNIMLKSYWKLMSRHHILWHWIHIHAYQFPKLPNLVSPITELTLQLNPHWKLVLNAYTYVPIPKITKFG